MVGALATFPGIALTLALLAPTPLLPTALICTYVVLPFVRPVMTIGAMDDPTETHVAPLLMLY
jgi:hypothetical protein